MNLIIPAIVIVGFIFLYIWFMYNEFVTLKMRIKEAWSQIDVQLKRRAELIPNLVETVKGYAKHEKSVFESVTKARSALMHADTPKAMAKADNDLGMALKSLFAVAENYPTLKASDNFTQLQKELSDTEDKVAYARQYYNTSVLDYNTKLRVLPNALLARYFHFKEEEFFQASEEEKKGIKVKFD